MAVSIGVFVYNYDWPAMQLGCFPGAKEPSQVLVFFFVTIVIREVQMQLMSGVPSLSPFCNLSSLGQLTSGICSY